MKPQPLYISKHVAKYTRDPSHLYKYLWPHFMRTTYIISLKGSKKSKSIHKKSEIPKKWHVVHYINKDGEARTRAAMVLGIQPTSSRSIRRDELDISLVLSPEFVHEKERQEQPTRQQEVETAPSS